MRNTTSEPQQGRPWEGDDPADVERTKEGCCYTTLHWVEMRGQETVRGKSLESLFGFKMQLFRGSLTDVEQHAALEIR